MATSKKSAKPAKSANAVALVVSLPEGMTAAQAQKMSAALETFLVDFGRATGRPGQRLKIRSVSGPAAPVPLRSGDKTITLPAVLLQHESGK